MTPEEKARALLENAWAYFWRHCGDTSAYYEFFMVAGELGEVLPIAESIIKGER